MINNVCKSSATSHNNYKIAFNSKLQIKKQLSRTLRLIIENFHVFQLDYILQLGIYSETAQYIYRAINIHRTGIRIVRLCCARGTMRYSYE